MVKFNNADDSNYQAVLSYMKQPKDGSTSPMRGMMHYAPCPGQRLHRREASNLGPLSEDDKSKFYRR